MRGASSPYPLPPLPRVGLGHNCPPILTLCPPAPAPSTCSTSCARGPGHRLPLLLPTDPGTLPRWGRSRPGRRSRPPPRSPPVTSSCHSRGATGDTSRRRGRGAAWSGSVRLSAHRARGTTGLVVLCAPSGAGYIKSWRGWRFLLN